MRMSRLTMSLPAVALAGALAASVAAPASAAPAAPSNRCPEGYVCFWSGADFTGTMTVYKDPVSHNRCDAIAGGARTVFNNDDQAWDFYQDGSCRAFAYDLQPGEYESGVRANSWT